MGIVNHANIECPFCRKRLNSWVRTNKFSKLGCKKFIDEKFMKKVEVLKEDLGEDLDKSIDNFQSFNKKNISLPGEVGEEHRKEQARLDRSRLEAERREEEESRLFIQKMLKEEGDRVDGERADRERKVKEMEEIDRRYAEELSKSLNKVVNDVEGFEAPCLSTRSKRRTKTVLEGFRTLDSKSKKTTISKNSDFRSDLDFRSDSEKPAEKLTPLDFDSTAPESVISETVNTENPENTENTKNIENTDTEESDKENNPENGTDDDNNNTTLSKALKRKEEKILSSRFKKKVKLGK